MTISANAIVNEQKDGKELLRTRAQIVGIAVYAMLMLHTATNTRGTVRWPDVHTGIYMVAVVSHSSVRLRFVWSLAHK